MKSKSIISILLVLSMLFTFVPSIFARHHRHSHAGEIFATAFAVGVVSSLVQPETVVEREVIVHEPYYVHPLPPPYPVRYYCPPPPPPPRLPPRHFPRNFPPPRHRW